MKASLFLLFKAISKIFAVINHLVYIHNHHTKKHPKFMYFSVFEKLHCFILYCSLFQYHIWKAVFVN